MSKRVVGTPAFEAKNMFYCIRDQHLDIWYDDFFNNASPPEGVTKEEYLEELKREYNKLEKEADKVKLGSLGRVKNYWDENNEEVFLTDSREKMIEYVDSEKNTFKNLTIEKETVYCTKATTRSIKN